VSDAPTAVARKAQGSPIAAGLIAFGAGLPVSSMVPASRAEASRAALKDTAQPMVDDLTDSAKEVAGNLQQPAQHAPGSGQGHRHPGRPTPSGTTPPPL
jgi:hypothetical protein